MVTVATAQIKIEKNYRKNLSTILQYLYKASHKKVDIVCFPETALVKNTNKNQLRKINFDFLLRTIKIACAENTISCVFSTNTIEKNKVYNRCYFIGDSGKILAKYDKIHMFKSEKGKITPGKKSVVIKTKYGNIGLCICWDSAYPEFIKSLSKKGAEIIFCLSYIKNYGRELESYLQIPYVRAFESSCYFVNCDSVNADCAQYSSICSPQKILASIKKKEGLSISKLDMRYISSVRKFYGLV